MSSVATTKNRRLRVTDNAGNRLCADIARAVYDHFDQARPADIAPAKKQDRD